jgi:hypothetical protein
MSPEAEALACWKCGSALRIPLPIGRRDDCPACHADLHVCRQCEFYDPRVSKACREPMADEVSDKERGNFCDYFRASTRGRATESGEAAAAKAKLDALFGGKSAPSASGVERQAADQAAKPQDDAAAAREKLEKLFGK